MAAGERWYFTKEQLLQTPSRKCGIDADKELSYRQQAANFIQDMGQRLQVTQLCINTAIVYMHRFYMFHSFLKFHRNAIATCALFLAAKVEEQPRKLEHVIKVANVCLNRDGPPLDTKSEAYLEQAQELVFNENIMLQTLGFDVAIDHPHTHVVKCCQLVRASKDLAQTSYFMATNSLHLTTMCMQYCPTVVACVCIHLACKWASWEIPCSSEGKEWFWYVDKTVTLELLEELTAEFLAILDKCPSRLKKKIMSAGKDVVSPPEKKSKAESTSSSNSSTSVVPSLNYEKSRSPFKAGDKLDRYEVITERFERAERAEKAEMDKRERLERMQRHEKLETKKDNFDKKMEFKCNLSDKAEWSNLSNKIDRIPEKRDVQLEVHNTSNVSQQQLHRIPSPSNQHHSSYKLSGKKRSEGTKSLTPKEYRELRERREKERHSSANSSHVSSRQKTSPQHTNKSSRPYSPDKARTRREESAPSVSDFNHSCNSVDLSHVTDPSHTQISHVDMLQQISRACDKAALLSHCSPLHHQNDVHSAAPPPPPPPPPLKVDIKLEEQKMSSQSASEKNRGNQDSLVVHQKTAKHEPLSPTIKKVVSSATEKQQDIKAVDSVQMQTVESSQTLTHVALKISPSPTEPLNVVSAEKLPEKLPQPPSEKHDRKERHKHKERDKERPRDKVDNSSTDFREPLSSPPSGSSSTPTSQRILLTIPKEKLNHSGTGYQDTSSPKEKGIKLKISKEMLTSTPKAGSVSGNDKLKVKIKIPKDTKNRYNSGSEGDRRKSESRKRDRDRSPKDSNSRNDYPRSPKHPRKESRSGRKEESLNLGPPSLLQLPMPPEPGQAVSRHNSWVKH